MKEVLDIFRGYPDDPFERDLFHKMVERYVCAAVKRREPIADEWLVFTGRWHRWRRMLKRKGYVQSLHPFEWEYRK